MTTACPEGRRGYNLSRVELDSNTEDLMKEKGGVSDLGLSPVSPC